MEEAARADRVVVMAGGQVKLDGAPRAVLTQTKRLRELRLDVPPAVAMAERLRGQGIPVPPDVLTPEELAEALCLLRSNA